MAVDSAVKRLSAQSVLFPGYSKGVISDGLATKADRQDTAWVYSGIAAGLATTRRYRVWKKTVGRKRWR